MSNIGPSVIALVAVSAVFLGALAWYAVLGLLGRRPQSAEIKARGETVFLPMALREYWDWAISPLTRRLIAARINPDAITWFSLACCAAAGIAFGAGYFGLGGWLYVLGGTCDMFDGKVARATGRSSKAGAFIDSTLDRYTEIFVLGGLAFFFRDSMVAVAAIAAMAGSVMVSYTRARGEGLGYSCREGGMQRAERIVYIGVAGIVGKLFEAFAPGRDWAELFLAFTITLLAVSTNVTAFQRFAMIVKELRAREVVEKAQANVLQHPTLRKLGS